MRAGRLALAVVACVGGSSISAAPAPPVAKAFHLTYTRQEHGAGLGPRTTVALDADGALRIQIDRRPDVRAVVPAAERARLAALVADPAIAPRAPANLRGEGVLVTLSITGDVAVDQRFQEPAPAALVPLLRAIEALVARPPVFSIAVTTQAFGHSIGPARTITVGADGTLAIVDGAKPAVQATLTTAQVAAVLALLDDPALARATSSAMRGEGVRVTITATGRVPLELHYQAGQGPPAAQALAQAIRALAPTENRP